METAREILKAVIEHKLAHKGQPPIALELNHQHVLDVLSDEHYCMNVELNSDGKIEAMWEIPVIRRYDCSEAALHDINGTRHIIQPLAAPDLSIPIDHFSKGE